jgi:hypothetical protein
MISWGHVQGAQTRYDDLIREAANIQLARQATAQGRTARNLIHYRALAWFGYRLKYFGLSRIERYGAELVPSLRLVNQVAYTHDQSRDAVLLRIN